MSQSQATCCLLRCALPSPIYVLLIGDIFVLYVTLVKAPYISRLLSISASREEKCSQAPLFAELQQQTVHSLGPCCQIYQLALHSHSHSFVLLQLLHSGNTEQQWVIRKCSIKNATYAFLTKECLSTFAGFDGSGRVIGLSIPKLLSA